MKKVTHEHRFVVFAGIPCVNKFVKVIETDSSIAAHYFEGRISELTKTIGPIIFDRLKQIDAEQLPFIKPLDTVPDDIEEGDELLGIIAEAVAYQAKHEKKSRVRK